MLGTVWVGWTTPTPGWLKLNVDGSVDDNKGPAGAGGVLRDSMGNWVGGFSTRLRECSMEEAETWALLHGLRLAWDLGARQLSVEINSLGVFSWVTGKEEVDNFLGNVVFECKNWCVRD